ncbi:MAG: type II toxin-antitoxin system death-on-curing family toxin [Betaproteobacteria bacterium]
MPRFLSLEAALYIHREQIEAHGGAHGLRDQNGLESALGAAEQTFAYTDSLHEAAAQYLVSLSRNHPFIDGNKRIAAACMLVFLDLNGIEPSFGPADLFEWTMEVAVGAIKREELAGRLRRQSRKRALRRR